MEKKSATPLYQQLVESIKNQISTGQLKEDDKLMTEQEFSEAYNVSRITVRKAMELLSDEGFVVKKQGIGTFVASKKLNRVMEGVMSFTESCEMNGCKASAELLSLEWKKASISIAKHLNINEGDKVLCIRRIRGCDEWKVMLEENYFPEKYGYILSENLNGSIYKILKSHGTIPVHYIKTVSICFPSEQEQEALELPDKQPLLLHRETVMDAERNVIHYTKLIINPEHYTLTIIR
ncbi:GntR family transcriptional regulator [Oribacterium sp. P6A1]|jgi:GntR family transcriptional regulator|uniref:GntR family transcriptional regulator n=1 Tax=Oribacterium sp. P6A1 TaxID=1410612 RepID=UPI000690D6FF|nr:GntR family transcriptional regulator [Oribacterium sp. P6A1]